MVKKKKKKIEGATIIRAKKRDQRYNCHRKKRTRSILSKKTY
jgi:hypothetical protein